MRTPSFTRLVLALALVGLLAACGRSPSGPTQPVLTARIEISGPRSVPPGATAQYSVTAHMTDGSTRELTSQVNWGSSNTSVLSITNTGLATGHRNGDALVSGQINAPFMRSSLEVVVVSPGTYRLAGQVREAAIPTGPVVDARVEITSGLATGLFTTTDTAGRYRLFGVSGEAQIRVTREGYEPFVQNLVLSGHETLNIELALLRPRKDHAGTYTLAIAASEPCRTSLPEEIWTRTYTAVVTQFGPQLDVRLSGATFVMVGSEGNRFPGRVEPVQIVFSLQETDFYYGILRDNLVEQIGTSVYVVWGAATTTDSPAGLSGTLDGALQLSEGSVFGRSLAGCRSSSHRFTLSR